MVTVRVLFIPTYLWCGVLRLVCLLPRGIYAKIFECGAFIYGVVLVTVTTISLVWGLCAFELFAETWGVVGLGLRLHLFFVSGTWFVNCYWSVT